MNLNSKAGVFTLIAMAIGCFGLPVYGPILQNHFSERTLSMDMHEALAWVVQNTGIAEQWVIGACLSVLNFLAYFGARITWRKIRGQKKAEIRVEQQYVDRAVPLSLLGYKLLSRLSDVKDWALFEPNKKDISITCRIADYKELSFHFLVAPNFNHVDQKVNTTPMIQFHYGSYDGVDITQELPLLDLECVGKRAFEVLKVLRNESLIAHKVATSLYIANIVKEL